MAIPERGRRSHFALRLEQGLGRLVLHERRVTDLFTVEEMQLGLPEVPNRLDMTVGVERFRHQRARLERMVLYAEDHDIGRVLRGRLRGGPIADIEVRALDGDLVFLGELAGDVPAPFICRARIEPASVADERVLLVSMYQARLFGPAVISAPALAGRIFDGLGLDRYLDGPTSATLDPVDPLLYEVCAELGWKVPGRRDVRLVETQCTAGRVRLVSARHKPGRVGPRGLGAVLESSSRSRRFLSDYEAKTLYASVEALIGEGHIERAIATYERQLEVHPDHPFLVTRLLQLLVTPAGNLADAAALARARLTRYGDDFDALCALAVVQQRQGQTEAAADSYRRIADLSEQSGDAVQAAQARCAMASALAQVDPSAAVRALEAALALRRRLPGALRALADLQARTGDWAAALRTRERLLAREEAPAARQALLHQLGQVALEQAGDLDAAIGYFERALEAVPDDVVALRGLADAQERAGRVLPAVRTLDRAARLLQDRGDQAGAAEALVRLGDLWRQDPDEGAATAALRYRQALMLVPGHPGALFGLAEAALAEGDPARARNALEELLRVIDDGRAEVDRYAVYLRLGAVLAHPGGDPPLAVAYYQKALAGDGRHAEAALTALEALHADAERWDDVARVLEMAVARATAPEERAGQLLRLAEVVDRRHGDEARAIKLLEEAAELRRDAPEVLEALARLHRRAERHAALAEVLARLSARVEAPTALATLYAERGDLLRLHLNDTDEAASAYSMALGCVPIHRGALEGLADVYRERERFGELATLLERLAGVVSAAEATDVWLELGRLQSIVLDKPVAAITSYEQARSGRPRDPEVLRPLGDLLFAHRSPADAVPHYLTLHGIYEAEGYDEPVAPFLERVAEVLAAVDRGDEALTYLSRAAEESPDRLSVHEAAQDVLLRRGDVEGIVDFFTHGLEAAMRPSVRRFLAKRAGRLAWRELRRPEQAAPLLDEVLRADPDDTDVRRMRLEVATALADWPRVAELLRAQLERASAAERPALLTSLAKLAYNALNRPDEGTQLALAALGEQPDYRPALTLLGERAFAAEDWTNARRAYAGLVQIEGKMAHRDDIYRLARAEHALGESDAARIRLLRLQEGGEASNDAVALLAELALDAEDAGAVMAVLADRLELPEAPADRHAFLRSAARLLTRFEDHREPGLDCWEALSTGLPDDDEARAALVLGGRIEPPAEPEPVAEPSAPEAPALDASSEPPLAMDAPDEFVPVAAPSAHRRVSGRVAPPADPSSDELPPLEQMAALPGEGEADVVDLEARIARLEGEPRAAALLELAELRRDRLYDPEGAIPIFEQVLDTAEPGDPSWVEAIEALEDLRAIRSEWPALLALYDRRQAAGVGDASELELQRASILRTMGELNEAIAAAARAGSGLRAIELRVGLLDQAGRPDEAAALLLTGLARLGAEEAAFRRWRAADLLAESSPKRALALLAEAHADLDDAELLERWVALARSEGAARALADALEAQAAALSDDGPDAVRRSGLLAEAADKALSIGAAGRARRLYEASLVAWGDNVDALERLAQLLTEVDDAPALATVRMQQIEAALPGPHRGRLALALARLSLDRLEDRAAAERWSAMATEDLVGTVDEAEARDFADTLRTPAIDWPSMIDRPTDEIIEALLDRSEALQSDPRARAEAARLLEEALGIEPRTLRAYELLESLYGVDHRWPELSGVLERHAAVVGARPERAELLLRRAKLAERVLGDPDGAAGAYERVLADPAGQPSTVAQAVDALTSIRTRRVDLERLRRLLDERVDHAGDDRVRAALIALRGGLWRTRLGHGGRARADFEAALRLDRYSDRAHLGLAQLAADRGDAGAASAHFERALLSDVAERTLSPNDVEAAFEGLRQALERLGRGDEVPMLAEEVLARHPRCRSARAIAGDDSVESIDTAPLPAVDSDE